MTGVLTLGPLLAALFLGAPLLCRAGMISYGTVAGIYVTACAICTVWGLSTESYGWAAWMTICGIGLAFAWWDERGWPLNRRRGRTR
jgi:hypothetical protein